MKLKDLYLANKAWRSNTIVEISDPTGLYFESKFSDLADVDSIWLGEVCSFWDDDVLMAEPICFESDEEFVKFVI